MPDLAGADSGGCTSDNTSKPHETKGQYTRKMKINRIYIVLLLALISQAHIPIFASYKIFERIMCLIVAATATELMFERLGKKGHYGIATYTVSLIHPAIFPFAAFTLHSSVSDIPVVSDLQATVLGNEYKARYRGKPNFKEVHSEHQATTSIAAVEAETKKSYWLRETVVFICIVAMFTCIHGSNGIILAFVFFSIYTAMQGQGGSHDIVRTSHITRINDREGVYAIEMANLWTEKHIGVGYLYNGTLTTKYHVTNGRPILIGDTRYHPCYYNTKADIVAYGAPPELVDVQDGDDIAVALSGPFSDVIVTYTTKVTVNEHGYVVFTGKKSVPGTSGSPFFKKCQTEEGVEYKFAGCIGWSMKDPKLKSNEITEIAMNTGLGFHTTSITRGSIHQHLAHPGSGKTRNITSLIHQGLNLYSRVYIAGPTRGVSAELLSAYQDDPIEGVIPRVLIKNLKRSRGVSKVTITTHATALRMLLKRDYTFTQPGLWILDESHFPDKATQALKHYLRHMITEKKIEASLYEMTATAYDIKTKNWCYCYGSNHPIKDTVMDIESMISKLVGDETRKAIVFVSSIKGKEKTSSLKLKEALAPTNKKVIEINRSNFTTAYPKAKEGNFDVILTTNISECGVNLDVDVCYDFQLGPRPLVSRWDDVTIRTHPITRGQYVQRRGRVGRRKEGEYIGPRSRYEFTDVLATDAYHLDVALFIKNYNITPMEPVYMMDEASNYSCTHEQILYLFAEGEDAAINSPLTLSLLIDPKGNLRTSDEIQEQVQMWSNAADVSRQSGNHVVHAKFWDDRDSDFYWTWKNIFDQSNNLGREERETLFTKARKVMFKVTKQLQHGVHLRRPMPDLEDLSAAEDGGDDEGAGSSGEGTSNVDTE